jgi:hypothetical protein
MGGACRMYEGDMKCIQPRKVENKFSFLTWIG